MALLSLTATFIVTPSFLRPGDSSCLSEAECACSPAPETKACVTRAEPSARGKGGTATLWQPDVNKWNSHSLCLKCPSGWITTGLHQTSLEKTQGGALKLGNPRSTLLQRTVLGFPWVFLCLVPDRQVSLSCTDIFWNPFCSLHKNRWFLL